MGKHRSGLLFPMLSFLAGTLFAACSGGADQPLQSCPTPNSPGENPQGMGGNTSGGGMTSTSQGAGGNLAQPPENEEESGVADNNFHHPNDSITPLVVDPFQILMERADEGPPELAARYHSCTKLPYSTLGELLKSRGVNLKMGGGAAADLYFNGGDALGVANYAGRLGEASFYSISAATKLFDIFTQAASEIIANIEKMDACKINGVGNPMFDAVTGKCVFHSLSCIMGRAATQEDMDLCNLMVAQANPNDAADKANKQKLAVATILSAAHTCE